MKNERKFCRRCHKKRVISNKRLGWCRACIAKVNDKYCYLKILPHPPDYDTILDMYSQGWSQTEIALQTKRSRTGIQGICTRYTQRIDDEGNVRPR